MKMFKKLMAVVLTAVMAVSMLTGCAAKNEMDMMNALKIAGKVNSVTVENGKDVKVGDDKLKLSAVVEDAAKKAANLVGEDVKAEKVTDFKGAKSVKVYVVKKQSSSDKWIAEAGKIVAGMMKEAKVYGNNNYKVAVDSFKAKKAADKNDKDEYIIVVVEKA